MNKLQAHVPVAALVLIGIGFFVAFGGAGLAVPGLLLWLDGYVR